MLEPATVPNEEVTQEGVGKYPGEVYIVVGSGDEALGEVVGRKFFGYGIF